MPRLILALCTAAFVLHSCAPEKEALTAQAASVKDSKELYAPAAFDWKTTKDCTLEVRGPKGMIEVNAPDGSLLAKAMNQGGSLELQFAVPNHIQDLSIAYAGVRSSVKATSRIKLDR